MLTVLVGPPASGKTNLARDYYPRSQVVEYDRMGEMLGAMIRYVTPWDFLVSTVFMRCMEGKSTVIDATNLRADERRVWLDMARRFGVPCAAVVLDVDHHLLLERDRKRSDPHEPTILVRCAARLEESLGVIFTEGFDHVRVVQPAA